MALSKIQSESMNLADTYAFTGTITGTDPALTDWQSFTSTVTFDSNINDTSPDESKTVTAYYIKIGKLVHVSWPVLTRGNFNNANAIISALSLPVATANNSIQFVGTTRHYNASGRYGTTHWQGDGDFVISVGSNSSTCNTYFATHNSAGSGFILLDGSNSSIEFSLTYVAGS